MLTQERLKEVLDYDASSGEFTWKVATSNTFKVGDIAGGATSDGYSKIGLDKKRYLAHRLVWLYVYGVFPEHTIDHINGITSDNRIINLRDVTHAENHKNQSLRKNNSSGVIGIYWDKPTHKWRAQIYLCGKTTHIGLFTDISDAIIARKEAEIKYGFHPNHGKSL